MSNQRPLPAFLKRTRPAILVERRSEPDLFFQMALAFMLAAVVLAIGAASAFYWLLTHAA
jgi:hypothetical protein